MNTKTENVPLDTISKYIQHLAETEGMVGKGAAIRLYGIERRLRQGGDLSSPTIRAFFEWKKANIKN